MTSRTRKLRTIQASRRAMASGTTTTTPPRAIMQGDALVGREVNLRWVDGKRYNAVVVRYFPDVDEYKLVYPYDDGVEVAAIEDRAWRLVEKRVSTAERPVLVGSIIEFTYPLDGRSYQAMVYSHTDDGEQLNVCYIDDHTTDYIGGKGWVYITRSPCALHMPPSMKELPDEGEHGSESVDERKDRTVAKKEEAKLEDDTSVDMGVRRGRISKRKPWLK